MENQQQLKIGMEETTALTCDECGSELFREATMIRKASRFITGTPQDALIPIPVFACLKCNHVNEFFLPKNQQA
jgi:hypothetical protein